MTVRFLVRPEVVEDARETYVWYETRSEGLGLEFLRVLYAALEEICRSPRLYPVVHPPFRRRLLRRFPYAVYSVLESGRIVITGVFHCARRPRRVHRDLRGRRGEGGR